jgi:hypothetical protein
MVQKNLFLKVFNMSLNKLKNFKMQDLNTFLFMEKIGEYYMYSIYYR